MTSENANRIEKGGEQKEERELPASSLLFLQKPNPAFRNLYKSPAVTAG